MPVWYAKALAKAVLFESSLKCEHGEKSGEVEPPDLTY